jgi:hypothetical protein
MRIPKGVAGASAHNGGTCNQPRECGFLCMALVRQRKGSKGKHMALRYELNHACGKNTHARCTWLTFNVFTMNGRFVGMVTRDRRTPSQWPGGEWYAEFPDCTVDTRRFRSRETAALRLVRGI